MRFVQILKSISKVIVNNILQRKKTKDFFISLIFSDLDCYLRTNNCKVFLLSFVSNGFRACQSQKSTEPITSIKRTCDVYLTATSRSQAHGFLRIKKNKVNLLNTFNLKVSR